MEESILQQSAGRVVESIRALNTNKSGLRKIRSRIAEKVTVKSKHSFDEPAKLTRSNQPNEGYGMVKGSSQQTHAFGEMPINIMVHDARSIHNGHTMEYVPGAAQANPEYFNF
jgi:hypothetical protein